MPTWRRKNKLIYHLIDIYALFLIYIISHEYNKIIFENVAFHKDADLFKIAHSLGTKLQPTPRVSRKFVLFLICLAHLIVFISSKI